MHRIGWSAQQLLLVQPCAERSTLLIVRAAVPFAALASCDVDELDPRTMVLTATAPVQHEAGEVTDVAGRWRLHVHFTASADCFGAIGRVRARCELWAAGRLQHALLSLVSSAVAEDGLRNGSGEWTRCRASVPDSPHSALCGTRCAHLSPRCQFFNAVCAQIRTAAIRRALTMRRTVRRMMRT